VVHFLLLAVLFSIVLAGCTTAPAAPKTKRAVVADIDSQEGPGQEMTREQLQEEVMRFADRFATQLTQVAEQIRYTEGRNERRVDMIHFQYVVNASPLDVAIAPNAVTNLLDMMVMASMAHYAAEKFWSQDLGHPQDRQALLETTARLEKDIWSISDKVLTPEQQQSMRDLIAAWIEEHPDVRSVLQIRFSAFSGQRTAALREVQRTGGLMGEVSRGLMGEVSRSVDAIEEMHQYGERLLFYMQRFPDLARLQSELAAYEVLDQQEIQSLVDDVDRITLVAERLTEMLPEERAAAIDQLMDRLATERQMLIEQVLAQEGELRATMADFSQLAVSIEKISEHLRETTASLERTALAINLDMGGESTEIGEYTELVATSLNTVSETRQLISELEKFVSAGSVNSRLPTAFSAVDEELDWLINRIFFFALLLIAFFFVSLFLYRAGSRRYLG
jgi:hypothetical protein